MCMFYKLLPPDKRILKIEERKRELIKEFSQLNNNLFDLKEDDILVLDMKAILNKIKELNDLINSVKTIED